MQFLQQCLHNARAIHKANDLSTMGLSGEKKKRGGPLILGSQELNDSDAGGILHEEVGKHQALSSCKNLGEGTEGNGDVLLVKGKENMRRASANCVMDSRVVHSAPRTLCCFREIARNFLKKESATEGMNKSTLPEQKLKEEQHCNGRQKDCARCGPTNTPYCNCPTCWGPVTSISAKTGFLSPGTLVSSGKDE